MRKLSTQFVDDLNVLDEATLDEITADGHTFARSSWLRLVGSLDLSKLVGGSLSLRFAVTFAGSHPVAVCPVLRISGPGQYFVYSLRRYYFEHWIEEALRLNPDKAAHFARLMHGVSAYRKLLEATGCPLDEWLLVTCPLSYRAHVPVAPSSPVERTRVYGHLLDWLKQHARRERLPLCLLGVEGSGNRLTQALRTQGFQPALLFFDNQIDLEPYTALEDYLGGFRRTTRRAFCREIRRTAESGVEFHSAGNLSEHADALSRLYTQTYSKYGDSFFKHPPDFWIDLSRHLGDDAEVLLAVRRGRLLGFSLLLHNVRRGELWTYRMGRVFESSESAPFYFGLSFYGPIERALQKGYRRLWLGPASYEAKSVRGARQIPLYNYFWFPRRWDRWVLLPYLKLFGRITHEEIARGVQRPLRIVGNDPGPADSTTSKTSVNDHELG